MANMRFGSWNDSYSSPSRLERKASREEGLKRFSPKAKKAKSNAVKNVLKKGKGEEVGRINTHRILD